MTSVFEWCCTNKTYCYCNDSNTARVFPNSFLKYSIFENHQRAVEELEHLTLLLYSTLTCLLFWR